MLARSARSSGVAGLLVLLSTALPPVDTGGPPEAGPRSSTGRLAGTVVVGETLASRRVRFSLYPDVSAAARAARSEPAVDEARNVVVYLDAPSLRSAGAGRPSPPPAMRQENLSFAPHVLPVVRGATVEFPNADPLYHNVFSLSKAASFDLGRYPSGSSKSVTLDAPGIVKVFCHIHADMSAVIMVLDNPFFAIPEAGGRFTIDGIPPGEYRVVAWHERARRLTRTVRIEAGATANVKFSIPLTEQAEAGE